MSGIGNTLKQARRATGFLLDTEEFHRQTDLTEFSIRDWLTSHPKAQRSKARASGRKE